MNDILNQPADVLALDVDETLIRRPSLGTPIPITSCLPAALAEAQSTMSLFLASSHSYDDAVYHLKRAGYDTGIFSMPVLALSIPPSKVMSAVLTYHMEILAHDALGKVAAMYNMLHTLGISDENILEAIAGKRKFDFVVSFGDQEKDILAARVFGFRHVDVSKLNGPMSDVVRGIHDANTKYEGPRWNARSHVPGPTSQRTLARFS